MRWDREQRKSLLGGMARSVKNVIRRWSVRADESGFWSLLGAGTDERVDGVEVFHGVGFQSSPADGADAEAVVAAVGAARGHRVVVASRDFANELTLSRDETAVWNTASVVYVKSDGTVEIRSRSGSAEALALASELADLKSRIASWTPVANDGGASLKAVFSAWPVPGTTKLKGE